MKNKLETLGRLRDYLFGAARLGIDAALRYHVGTKRPSTNPKAKDKSRRKGR